MGFEFKQEFVDDDGEFDEDEVQSYDDELLELFGKSPEYRAFREGGGDGGWLDIFLDYARGYYGDMAWRIDVHVMRRLLLEIFPRKVSCSPDAAADMVAEQRAFWTFLDRAFKAEHAKECLRGLDDRLVKELERKLGDTSKFEMAKSFFMAGQQAGFDLSTEAGLQAWVGAHNAGLAGDHDDWHSPLLVGAGDPAPGRQAASKKSKRKRKAVKASRRRNRR